MFHLFVNSIDFYALPYKYDLTKEGDVDVKYKAKVEFNDKKSLLPVPWNNQAFIKNIQEAFGDSSLQITKAIINISQSNSSVVINEICDSMVQFSSNVKGIQDL